MEQLINKTLNNIISDFNVDNGLRDAISYAVNSGGKRVRPKITCLVYKSKKGDLSDDILMVAAAVEMIHTASLIHDDLPGIDNDDFRRMKPTVHKQFDEATAILAGDLLFIKGLEILSKNERFVELGGKAIERLINGEYLDVKYEGKKVEYNRWFDMVNGKTAALIELSFEIGAISAGFSREETKILGDAGEFVGIAFQMTDDLLDVIGEENEVGKRLRKDVQIGKCTALEYFSVDELKNKIDDYFDRGLEKIKLIEGDFKDLTDFLILLKKRNR